ncbi:hypothetical protein H0X09_00010 [Candidatus Saccharibacteria bacterium]|nr:hypothetical protein [Candidatus Saccharibacteria bacterium]
MDENSDASWQYKPDSSDENQEPVPDNSGANSEKPLSKTADTISWTASEYIDHQHSSGWYGALAGGTLVLAAGIYFLTKEYFATGVILAVGIIVGVFASRKPREIKYEISNSGIRIADKKYSFRQFRSFTVVNEGDINSVSLLPLKRFMPPISAYYPPADEERIVNALGEHIPHEDRKPDRIERLTSRLRF